MKYKIIPFNYYLAKKISNREIKHAKISNYSNDKIEIISFDGTEQLPIVAKVKDKDNNEEIICSFTYDGVYPLNKNKNLIILINEKYQDYSNFKPKKYEPCVVRKLYCDTWGVAVATVHKTQMVGDFFIERFISSYEQCLPLNDTTAKLIGIKKDYEDLFK